MQKIIDFYFLILSSIICIYLLFCCFYDNSWTVISITALSVLLIILHILNVYRPSLISRRIVKYITLIVCVVTVLALPLFIIIATYRFKIILYLATAFCILNIILILCMRADRRDRWALFKINEMGKKIGNRRWIRGLSGLLWFRII